MRGRVLVLAASAGGFFEPRTSALACLQGGTGPCVCLWLVLHPVPFHMLEQTAAPQMAEPQPGSVDETACCPGWKCPGRTCPGRMCPGCTCPGQTHYESKNQPWL